MSSNNDHKCVQGFGRRRLWLTPVFHSRFMGREQAVRTKLLPVGVSAVVARQWTGRQAGRCSQLMATNNYSTSSCQYSQQQLRTRNLFWSSPVKRLHSIVTYFLIRLAIKMCGWFVVFCVHTALPRRCVLRPYSTVAKRQIMLWFHLPLTVLPRP